MRLGIEGKTIVIYDNNGKVPEDFGRWQYAVWGNLHAQDPEDILGATNSWLSTLSSETTEEIINFYERTYSIILNTSEPEDIVNAVRNEIRGLCKLFSFEHAYAHVERHKLVREDVDSPTAYNNEGSAQAKRFPRNLTYLRKESSELATFAVPLKLLMPIWGMLAQVFAKPIGGKHKEEYVLRTIYNTPFANEPAYKRLELYATALANRRGSGLNIAVTAQISRAQLPAVILGLALVRRVIVYPITDTSDSIVSFMYKFLEGTFTSFAQNSYIDKGQSSKDNGGEESVIDDNRIPELITDQDRIEVGYYCMRRDWLARDLFKNTGIEPDLDRIEQLHAELCNRMSLAIGDTHLALTAFTLRHVVSPPMIKHMVIVEFEGMDGSIKTNQDIGKLGEPNGRKPFLSAMAVAAHYMECRGLESLRDVYVMTATKKLPNEMSASDSLNQPARLPSDLSKQVEATYKYMPKQFSTRVADNVGLKLIERVSNYACANSFEKVIDLVDLKKQVATLIIEAQQEAPL